MNDVPCRRKDLVSKERSTKKYERFGFITLRQGYNPSFITLRQMLKMFTSTG
jgi:hypothetical protein